MAGPNDYTIQQPNIGGSILGGIQAGNEAIAGMAQADAAKQAAARHQQFSTDLQSHLANPSFKSTSELIAKYPEFQKSLSASFDTLDKGQKEETFKAGTQAIVAIRNGKPEVAKKILDDRITAYENSGQDTTDLVSLRQHLDDDPRAVETGLGLTMASLNPEGWGKIASEERAAKLAPYELGKAKAEYGIKQVEAQYAPETAFLGNAKARADIKNTISTVNDRIDRLGLDRDKFTSDVEARVSEQMQKAGEVPESARTIINDGAVNAVAAEQSAAKSLDLADQLDKLGAGGYGAFSKASEWWKSATGDQDAWTNARNDYVRLRNTQAVKNLPPGAASDADVAMALKGFPSETADAKTLSSFVRGMAKMSQADAAFQNAKSEWAGAVGHLGNAKRDIVIDGVNVPKGTSLVDFSRNYLGQKAKQIGAQQSQAQVPQRSYMRFAQPGGQ